MSNCGKCQKPVTGKMYMALDKKFHPECFTCFTCKRKLFELGAYYEDEGTGQVYCERHFCELMGLICPGCQDPITSNLMVTQLGKV